MFASLFILFVLALGAVLLLGLFVGAIALGLRAPAARRHVKTAPASGTIDTAEMWQHPAPPIPEVPMAPPSEPPAPPQHDHHATAQHHVQHAAHHPAAPAHAAPEMTHPAHHAMPDTSFSPPPDTSSHSHHSH